jgi:MFS family permease
MSCLFCGVCCRRFCIDPPGTYTLLRFPANPSMLATTLIRRTQVVETRGIGLDRERWRILVWMCVLISANQLGFGAIVPVVPLFAQQYGVSQSAIGLTIAVYGLSRFLVNVPAGRLADARGRRTTLALGGLITVVGTVLCAVAPSYTLFLIARFIAGAGAACVLTGGQIVLTDISGNRNRGRVMAIYQGVFLVTVGAGAFPGGWLAENVGLAAPFWTSAGLASVSRSSPGTSSRKRVASSLGQRGSEREHRNPSSPCPVGPSFGSSWLRRGSSLSAWSGSPPSLPAPARYSTSSRSWPTTG